MVTRRHINSSNAYIADSNSNKLGIDMELVKPGI